MPVIPALGRKKQKDCQKFKASLSYIVRLSPKTIKRKKIQAAAHCSHAVYAK